MPRLHEELSQKLWDAKASFTIKWYPVRMGKGLRMEKLREPYKQHVPKSFQILYMKNCLKNSSICSNILINKITEIITSRLKVQLKGT